MQGRAVKIWNFLWPMSDPVGRSKYNTLATFEAVMMLAI